MPPLCRASVGSAFGSGASGRGHGRDINAERCFEFLQNDVIESGHEALRAGQSALTENVYASTWAIASPARVRPFPWCADSIGIEPAQTRNIYVITAYRLFFDMGPIRFRPIEGRAGKGGPDARIEIDFWFTPLRRNVDLVSATTGSAISSAGLLINAVWSGPSAISVKVRIEAPLASIV